MILERVIKRLRRLRPTIVHVKLFKYRCRCTSAICGIKQQQLWHLYVVFSDSNPTGVKSSVAYRVLFSGYRGCQHLVLPNSAVERYAGTHTCVCRRSQDWMARADGAGAVRRVVVESLYFRPATKIYWCR